MAMEPIPIPVDVDPRPLTPLPEVVELDADSGWEQWDLAVRLGDVGRVGA